MHLLQCTENMTSLILTFHFCFYVSITLADCLLIYVILQYSLVSLCGGYTIPCAGSFLAQRFSKKHSLEYPRH